MATIEYAVLARSSTGSEFELGTLVFDTDEAEFTATIDELAAMLHHIAEQISHNRRRHTDPDPGMGQPMSDLT